MSLSDPSSPVDFHHVYINGNSIPQSSPDFMLTKKQSILSLADSAYTSLPRQRKASVDSLSSNCNSSYSSSDYIKRGLMYYRISQFDMAFRYFQKAVWAIHNPNSFAAAQSLACIGNCYLLGHGTDKNISVGLDFFKEASKSTLKRHQLELFLYFTDRPSVEYSGVQTKIMEWLLDIADEYAPAQYLVGQCYLQGLYGCLIQKDLGNKYLALSFQDQKHNDDMIHSSFSWHIIELEAADGFVSGGFL